MVGQAALHDVGAVVGAGFDGGQAATVRAVNQLRQGLHTLWTQRNLRRSGKTVSIANLRASSERTFTSRVLFLPFTLDVVRKAVLKESARKRTPSRGRYCNIIRDTS